MILGGLTSRRGVIIPHQSTASHPNMLPICVRQLSRNISLRTNHSNISTPGPTIINRLTISHSITNQPSRPLSQRQPTSRLTPRRSTTSPLAMNNRAQPIISRPFIKRAAAA
jgi:hypothetical protein